jgi:hypothetical protein
VKKAEKAQAVRSVAIDEAPRRHLIEHHLQHIERHAKELRRILQEQS